MGTDNLETCVPAEQDHRPIRKNSLSVISHTDSSLPQTLAALNRSNRNPPANTGKRDHGKHETMGYLLHHTRSLPFFPDLRPPKLEAWGGAQQAAFARTSPGDISQHQMKNI